MTYQRYDRYLEDYPSIPDEVLRNRFARQVGMKPNDLRALYTRCAMRWTRDNPQESEDYLKKELEGFVKDCATRPKKDPACKAVLGK